MPNYAIPTSANLDTSPFTQAMSNLSPAGRTLFNLDPQTAFEFFLAQIDPSNTQQRVLRQAMPSILRRFQAEQAANFSQNGGQQFTDFLRNFNVNQELAALSPGARSEQPDRFRARTRILSF